MAIHGCMLLHSICQYCLILPLWNVKTESQFQSFKALKIDSFAKNHKYSNGHGGLIKDMIINPEVVLQFVDQEKITKMVISGSQLITG